jgi:hypothetical protein
MINAIKLILGITLGLATLGALAGTAGYYFFTTNLSAKPKRPVFAEESRPKAATPKPSASPKASPSDRATPKTKPKTEEPEESPTLAPLPPGAYSGSIVWETGVSLKEEPDPNSGKSGSVGFREKVTVLEASSDKLWLKVRNSDGTQEGWIKAGNLEREEADSEASPAVSPSPKTR